MEGTTVLEKHHRNHVSKSVGTLIQIGSISIDLVNANDISNAGKCEHFTIRGYVSEMRKKDWKTGWPFPLDDNYEKSEEKMCFLPSLAVPKSRWWRCRNCLCAENIVANTNGSVLKCCSVKFNLSANMNNKDCCHSQPVEQKEEKIEDVNNTNEGDGNGAAVNRDREISVSIAAGAIHSQIHERCNMDQTAEAVKANCNESVVEADNEDAVNAFKKHLGRYPSLEVDENTYTSPSASLPDISAGLSRKRTRKSRLITELLAEKRDANTYVIRKENSPHISIFDATAEASVPSPSEARLSIQEELPSVASKNRNMKRKFTLADGGRPLEMCTTSHVPKKTVSSAGKTDTIASSGSEEHAGARVGSIAHSNDNRIEKSPAMGKKKQKTNKIVHESSSVEPFLENMQRESLQQIDKETDNASFKQGGRVGFTDKGNGLLTFPALEMDQISYKKINNMGQDDRQASLTYWNIYNMLRESPNTVRDKCNMQTGSITIPFQSVQNAHPDQGWNHSLNSYMAMQRCNVESDPQFTGGPAYLTSLQKGISEKGLIKRNDVNMSFTPGSRNQGELEAYFQRAAFCCDLNNKKTSNKYPLLNGYQIESRHCTDSAETSNKGTAIEIRENSAPSRKFNDRRAESAEVMEIAELMAKNQYERCLPDAGCDKKRANNTRGAQVLDLNEAYIGGDSSLLQDNNSERRKYQRDGGNGNIKISENAGTTKEKTFDYSSNLSRSHLGQTYTSSGLSRQVTGQNIQCTGNVFGKSSFHAGLAPSDRVYSNLEGTPPQAEALTRLWPSMYPSHGYQFAQNHADHSINKDVLSHCQGNLTKGILIGNRNPSFLNPNGCSFDEKGGNSVSEALWKRQGEYSKRGSMDLHSIDALPAMHLLSLVDTNLPTGPTVVDANGSTRLLQRPPFPYHKSKEFPGLPLGEYRTNTVKPPTNDNSGKTHISQNSNGRFPTIPTAGASPFPFEHRKSLKSGSNFVDQVSPKSRGRGKAKVSVSPTVNRGSSSQHPALVIGGLGTTRGSLPGHCGSSSTLFTQQFPALGDGNTQKIEAPRTSHTVQPLKSIVQCSVNRNPADFSIPESGNDYMIAGEDLKFRSPVTSDNRAGLIKADGQKRLTKTSVLKEPARRQLL